MEIGQQSFVNHPADLHRAGSQPGVLDISRPDPALSIHRSSAGAYPLSNMANRFCSRSGAFGDRSAISVRRNIRSERSKVRSGCAP
jgi:hypothetical protein